MAPSGTKRDPWFDNAKFALVTLVVVGHTWTLLPTNATNSWLYDFLYAWHVPAFVLITGYLSRSFDYTDARLGSLFRTVVVPYVLFEALLAAFRIWVGGEKLNDLWADPHWPMWYLSALFFWRLATPIFKRLHVGRLRLAVPVAVAISLAAGARATDTLDMARVLGLLPFFVIGLCLRKEHFEVLHRRWVRVTGLAVLVAIFVTARFTDQLIGRTEWLYYRAPYDELHDSDLESMGIRLALIAVGTLGAFAFLSLVPRHRTWYSGLGGATLVVYLFHGFVVKGVGYTGFPGWAADHAVLSLLIATPAAVALSALLSLPRTAHVLGKAVDPIGALNQWRGRAAHGHHPERDPHPDTPRAPVPTSETTR